MKKYTALVTAKGYYCNMCDRYHAESDMLHRYTFDCVGAWKGNFSAILPESINDTLLCPACKHDDELEDFDRYLWSHLVAYQRATGAPMVFECPIFDRDTNGPTTGYEWVATADEVEEKADWYAIEVEDIRYDAEGIVVRLDFQ